MADFYTSSKISAMIRARLDDSSEPYLISDTLLAEALDDAQREYAKRTLCLRDASNYSITVTADEPLYDVDPLIMSIRSARLATSLRNVVPTTLAQISERIGTPDYGLFTSNWQDATGTPEFAITDMETDKIRLVPIPTYTSETMNLIVYLYPTPITALDVELTIPDRMRPDLVAGALHRLYRIEDAEIYDPKAADRWGRDWAEKLHRAESDLKRDTRGGGVVRMSTRGVW
jgi:hypothetical protein